MRLLRRRSSRRGRGSPPLPAVRQGVKLTLTEDEFFPARVTRVSKEQVVLVLLLEADDAVRDGTFAEALLDFTSPRGWVRLVGRARVELPDVVFFDIDDVAEIVQRRDYVRARVVRPLALAPIDEEGHVGPWIDTLTINVSGNGFLASGPNTLAVGSAVRFRARLIDGEPPIEGRGRVARMTDEGHCGIAIEELAKAERERLVAFVFERERLARRLTRERE